MGKILNTNNPGKLNSLEIRNKRNKANIILEEDEVKILVNGREKYNLGDISGGKQDTLVSGTNIKTINGNSILGGGNMVIDIPDELNGTNYLMVYGTGTPSENAAELQAAYDEAKTMSPSSNNIITVVVAPGKYTFGQEFTLDTAGINIVSLTGNPDVSINEVNIANSYISVIGVSGRIGISKSEGTDIFVKKCQSITTGGFHCEALETGDKLIAKFQECSCVDECFNVGVGIDSECTYIDCGEINAADCFNMGGTSANANTFIRCIAQNSSFSGNEGSSFYYCISGALSGIVDGNYVFYCIVDNVAVANS